MGTFRDRMYTTALRLLTKYGEAVTAVRNNTSGYVPATGAVTQDADTTYSGMGYPSNYNKANIDNVLIQQNDILLIFSSSTEPLINDIITVQSKAYTALSIQNITAQGQNVIYKVQLRQ